MSENCLSGLTKEQLKLLKVSLYSRQAFFWIGSGFSANYGYTSWSGMLKELAAEYEYKNPLPENPLRAAELLAAAARRKDVSEIAFCERVCSLLEEKRTKVEKPAWARLFAKIAPDIIVTTNWDQLLENEIFDGLATVLIRRVGKSQLSRSGRNILKIHGDMSHPESLVFTHSQYNAFQRADNYLSRKVYTLFSEMTPIFLGYSLSDPNVFFLYDEALSDGNYANQGFMVVPRKLEGEVFEEYKLLLEHKGIIVIQADLPEFLEAIDKELDAMHGSVDAFQEKYKQIMGRLEAIIAASVERKIVAKDLSDKFNLDESGGQALQALTEILQRPELYQALGGTLSPFNNVIPSVAVHYIAQAGIAIGNKTTHIGPFREAVIKSAISRLKSWDFNTSEIPMVDLMSIRPEANSPLSREKIETLIPVLDWSAPRYERGYCWATWDVFVGKMDWLHDYEKEALLNEVSAQADGGALGYNRRRWVAKLSEKLTGDLKVKAEALLSQGG